MEIYRDNFSTWADNFKFPIIYFMNPKRLLKSFKDAAKGIKYVFKREQNFRLQILMAVIVLIVMFFFQLRKHEMVVIMLLILLVMILELLNSALEAFTDVVKPRLDQQVEIIKDIMAGVVLLASLGAMVIGLIIFWPYVVGLFVN